MHKIVNEKRSIHMKKMVYRWFYYNLILKAECVRISKEILKLLNWGGHNILSKIITNDAHFFFRQENKVWIF